MKTLSRFLLALVAYTLATAAFAQPGMGPGRGNMPERGIVGRIIDTESGMPIPNANIIVLHTDTEEQADGTASRQRGFFVVRDLPNGTYDVRIRVLGYQTMTFAAITLSDAQPLVRLGEIEMSSEALALPDVAVTAQRNDVLLAADRKIYRVTENSIDAGGSAADVLENIPSVEVDLDGNVSLRGDANVRILIDGKPSSRIGLDPAEALQQLPADMIERVEVMTNPSAKFDAEGTAGIINLVMKKQKKEGVNGAVTVNVGYPARYGGSFNMNYRIGKFNLFVNEGLHHRTRLGIGELERDYYTPNPYARLEEESDRKRSGWDNDFRIGFEYHPDDKQTLTVSAYNEYEEDENDDEIEYRYYDTAGDLVSHIKRTNPEEETERWYEGDIDYRYQFNTDGHELTADYQFEHGSEHELSTVEERYLVGGGSAGPSYQHVDNLEEETRHMGSLDYTNPFSKDGKFETGLKADMRTLDHGYTVTDLDASGGSQILTDFSNDLKYERNIFAAYATYANRVGLLAYQLGLRMEHSQVTTDFQATNEVNDREYTDLFPSVHLTYDITVVNAVQASYTRRLRRPRYWYLIPFWSFADSRNIRRGNPNLDPMYSDSYELGHLYHTDRGSMSTSIFYRHTTGEIEWVETASDSIVVMSPYNVGTSDHYGLEWILSGNITPWMMARVNAHLFQAYSEGSFAGQDFETENFTWMGRGSLRFMLSQVDQLQFRYGYRGPRESFQGKRKPAGMLAIGYSRTLFGGQGTLNLGVRDVLETRKREMKTWTDTFYSYSKYSRHGRTWSVSLTWRFNQDRRQQRRPGENGMNGFDDMDAEME